MGEFPIRCPLIVTLILSSRPESMRTSHPLPSRQWLTRFRSDVHMARRSIASRTWNGQRLRFAIGFVENVVLHDVLHEWQATVLGWLDDDIGGIGGRFHLFHAHLLRWFSALQRVRMSADAWIQCTAFEAQTEVTFRWSVLKARLRLSRANVTRDAMRTERTLS